MTYNTDSNNNFVVALSAAIQQEVPKGLIAFESYSLTDSGWHEIVANAVEKALDRTNRTDLAGLRMDAENVHLREILVGILQANASSAVRGNDLLQEVANIAEELLADRPDWSYMLDRVKGQWELEEDIEARTHSNGAARRAARLQSHAEKRERKQAEQAEWGAQAQAAGFLDNLDELPAMTIPDIAQALVDAQGRGTFLLDHQPTETELLELGRAIKAADEQIDEYLSSHEVYALYADDNNDGD